MSPELSVLTPEEHDELETTVLLRHKLEPQFKDLEQQHETAVLGMWVFLATEVIFFGALFLGVYVYVYKYHEAAERASERLNWIIGGSNTVVLLVSSLFMALAVHCAKLGNQRRLVQCLTLTALLGMCFLCLKGLEYYTDWRDNLIPGWRFDESEWTHPKDLAPGEKPLEPHQVSHVKLFLLFYWIMTGLHATHVTIGVLVIVVMILLARRGLFPSHYYSPVDVTALYWHFVDLVWIFLFPTLYLLGTHTMADFHF
jgi:cytochrome c oxidase subunit III